MSAEPLVDGRVARRDRNRTAVLDAVLELFAARHRVTIEVDGYPFGAWVATTPFSHRAAVRVTSVERRP